MNVHEAAMSFAPDIIEMLARARADLRMGVPVVLTGANPVLILAVETLTPQRLAIIQTLGSKPSLKALTYTCPHVHLLLGRRK